MSGQLSVAPGSETNSGFGKNQIGLIKKLKSTWFQELQPVSRPLIRRNFMRISLGDDVFDGISRGRGRGAIPPHVPSSFYSGASKLSGGLSQSCGLCQLSGLTG